MADSGGQTKPELQEECRRRGLPISGNKDDLAARLEQYEAAKTAQTQPPATNPPPAAPAAAPGAEAETPGGPDVRVWRIVRQVDPFDDDAHQQLLAEVVADAQKRGYVTRGPAYREEYGSGLGTYAVHVRPIGG